MGSEDDGVPLFGDLYRKCATFFTDIDNMISLESFEYAENQLRIAGATAKETCSKFIEETLPELFSDSSVFGSTNPEENGCTEVPVAELLKDDIGHANGQSISNEFTEGDTQDIINTESPNAPEDTNQSIIVDEKKMSNLHIFSTGLESSINTNADEENWVCLEISEPEDEDDASSCLKRKTQMKKPEGSDWEFEDCCESDWEII